MIAGLRTRPRELGRLRFGDRDPVSGRPVALATWRLTSPYRDLLEAAASLWGGEVRAWEDAPTSGEQWDLVTEASELEVLVPPQDIAAAQAYELWRAGGVVRRCDGETELLSGGPCECDPARRDCDVSTHLLLVLPQLPDLGVWRLRTTGWAAAQELPWAVELLLRLAGPAALARGRLAIETRTRKVEGQTRHFAVPVLRAVGSLAEALAVLEGASAHASLAPVADPGVTGSAALLGDAAPAGERRPVGGAGPALPAGAPVPEPGEGDGAEGRPADDARPAEPAGEGSAPPLSSEERATAEQWERALRHYGSRARVLRRVCELHPDEAPATAGDITRAQMARLLLRAGEGGRA